MFASDLSKFLKSAQFFVFKGVFNFQLTVYKFVIFSLVAFSALFLRC